MTVAPREGGSPPATQDDDGMVGLEDFDATTDAVMPRLKIVGKDAQFEDNLSGERHDTITAMPRSTCASRARVATRSSSSRPISAGAKRTR